jgi:DNA sulfur modification protein DndD
MERAGLADVEEKLIRMGGAVQEIMGRAPALFTEIDRLQKEKSTDRQEISRIESELESISDRLRGSPREEISGLESRLTEVRERIRCSQREIGRLAGEIGRLRDDIVRLDQEIQRHKTFEARQTLALRRIDACGEAATRIAAIRERLEARFRVELEHKVRELFNEMSPTPYVPSLGDDYSLRLLDSAGGTPLPVASSTGESQILSLAFIGSIIEVTREFQSRKTNISAPAGGGYPIVMDSPFGSLDPNYRHQVAEHIPALADQVIVMVSQTQWRGEVERSLADRSPRHYVLSYNTPKDEVKESKIKVGDKDFWAIRRSPNSHEYTEIVEVTSG